MNARSFSSCTYNISILISCHCISQKSYMLINSNLQAQQFSYFYYSDKISSTFKCILLIYLHVLFTAQTDGLHSKMEETLDTVSDYILCFTQMTTTHYIAVYDLFQGLPSPGYFFARSSKNHSPAFTFTSLKNKQKIFESKCLQLHFFKCSVTT